MYGNKKWSLNFHDQSKSQNPTYCFFFSLSEFTVSTLLIILLSLLALYQLLVHKKSTFRANTHTYHISHISILPFVLWSSPVEQSIKSEVLMTTTYHLLKWLSQYTSRVLARFRSVSLPNQKEFNRQNKRNGH